MSFFKHHVFICGQNRAVGDDRPSCASAGGPALGSHLWQRVSDLGLEGVRITPTACLGVCAAGPVLVIYPDNVWYTATNTADIDAIVDSHLASGKVVDRLKLDPATHRVED